MADGTSNGCRSVGDLAGLGRWGGWLGRMGDWADGGVGVISQGW